MEIIKEEKQKLKQSINNEKKLTEEAVKKIYQLVQEKPKGANTKNTSETKRLEKENKRLQLELNTVSKWFFFIYLLQLIRLILFNRNVKSSFT